MTQKFTLDNTWQLITSGAGYVEKATTNSILIHIGTSLPSANTQDFLELSTNINYLGDENIYARSNHIESSMVVLIKG